MSIHWSIVLAKVDLVALYFRLLWCYGILRGSIDQKHTKTNEIWRQNSEIHPVSLVLAGLHDFQIFPDHMAHAWSVEVGSICLVSVFFVRVASQICPRRAKKDSNIPYPGRTRSVKCPTPGPTKTIKSPPHAQHPLIRKRGKSLVAEISSFDTQKYKNLFSQARSNSLIL